MALFRRGPRRVERATDAQLGRVADPEAHARPQAPDVMAWQESRDEMPDIVLYAPREARSWRPRQALHGRVDGAPFAGDDTNPGVMYGEHAHAGSPDPRRVYDTLTPAGYPQTPADSLRRPETMLNARPPVDTPGANGAPARPRAGSTTADEARPAAMPRWESTRPFDQWAAQHMSGLDKIPEAAPTAAEPVTQDSSTAGAVPYPGGTGDPVRGMTGIGIQPNTIRILPRAWDEELVNVSPPVADPFARERRWRL